MISSALRFQSRKVCASFFGEAGDVGDGLVEVAAEHERGAVEMGLAELVARGDVADLVGEVEILEPGRLADAGND